MNKCLFCKSPVKNKFCNVSCQNRYRFKYYKPKKKIKKIIKEKCKKCNKIFKQEIIVGEYIRKFCSRKCANSRTWDKNETKKVKCIGCGNIVIRKKRSTNNARCKECGKKEKRKRHFNNYVRVKNFCKNCNKMFFAFRKDRIFCSSFCLGQYSGKKSKKIKRSYNEIYFAKLCRKEFKKIFTNKRMFNGWDTDVIIEDFKIAILWNGKWHYKKCNKKHSVKQVQNRDKIKIKEIKKCGYLPYIIKDEKGKNNEFVEDEFSKFLLFLGLVWSNFLNDSEYIGFSDKEKIEIRKRLPKK